MISLLGTFVVVVITDMSHIVATMSSPLRRSSLMLADFGQDLRPCRSSSLFFCQKTFPVCRGAPSSGCVHVLLALLGVNRLHQTSACHNWDVLTKDLGSAVLKVGPFRADPADLGEDLGRFLPQRLPRIVLDDKGFTR